MQILTPKTERRAQNARRGSVALSAIGALVILLIVVLGLMALANAVLLSGSHTSRTRALRNLAESGLQYGYWSYTYNNVPLPYSSTNDLGPGRFTVSVTDNSANLANTFKVVSTATSRNDTLTATRIYPSNRTKIYVIDSNGSQAQIIQMDDISGTNVTTCQLGAIWAFFLAVDDSGRIYYVDFSNGRIVRQDDITGKNRVTLTYTINGQQGNPIGICLDSSGRIYCTDWNGKAIVRFDDMKGNNQIVCTPGIGQSESVFVAADGRIYIADTTSNRIVRMDDMKGSNAIFYSGGLNLPTSISVDSKNRIYVTDYGNSQIVRMDDMTGSNQITCNKGMYGPSGLFVENSGRITVADSDGSHPNQVFQLDAMDGGNFKSYGADEYGPNDVFVK